MVTHAASTTEKSSDPRRVTGLHTWTAVRKTMKKKELSRVVGSDLRSDCATTRLRRSVMAAINMRIADSVLAILDYSERPVARRQSSLNIAACSVTYSAFKLYETVDNLYGYMRFVMTIAHLACKNRR